jgi:hypothetical protein
MRRSNAEKLDFEIAATESGISEAYSARKDERKRPPEEQGTPIINLTESPMTNSASTYMSSFSAKRINSSNRATFQTTLAGMSQATSKEAELRANVSIAHWILANNRPHNTSEDPLFTRMLKHIQQCGSSYKPPTRYEIGGTLLDSTFETYYEEELKKLMEDIYIYGASIYGDGATVKGTPLINVMASSPNNPACVLDVIDCTGHQQAGGKKDAKFISQEMLKFMVKIDPKKQYFTQILFDGASNVQKAGQCMAQHYPRAEVNHGAEHVVALVMEKFVNLTPLKEYSKFAKMVCQSLYNSYLCKTFLNFVFNTQLRNIFGSTRHGPRAVFRKHAKAHNNGKEINLMKPSETRMAGEVLQFLRLFRLKEALQSTTRDRVFVEYKRFGFVTTILNNEDFWNCLFAIIQACYPVFRILRLADMKIGGMDKLYYYVCQTDRLLEPAMHNVMMLWKKSSMPKLLLDKMNLSAEDKNFLKGMLFSNCSYCFVNNQTLNRILFLEFDKESKANKQVTKPEVAGDEDVLFQLASDDDASDDEEDMHFDDDTDSDDTPVAEDDLVTRSTSIWNCYKPKLTTDLAMVAYLCSPNPHIIKHSQELTNMSPQVHLAVDRVIERLVLTRRDYTSENKDNVLADLIEKFWKERDEFVCRKGYFSREHIWVSAKREDCVSHQWHKRYSLGFTDVFGEVGCLTTSPTLGCGQAERNWKEFKDNRSGKRSNLSPEKAKKLSVISASYSHKKCEARRVQAQKAGVIWTDDDFKYCKLDSYCSESIIEKLKENEVRVFHAYMEDWEKMQFNSKGDEVYAARVSAKYGGIKYIDCDKEDEEDESVGKIGEFRELDCAVLTKIRRGGADATRTVSVGRGFSHFYSILGVYKGFEIGTDYKEQDESLYDMWEREWDVYSMIIDYYEKYPDKNVRIVMEPIDVDEDESSNSEEE